MADVQVEHGHTRIANALLEALCRTRMPGRHKDVALAMIRLLYGYNKTEDRIGTTQIAQLVGEADGGNVRRILRDLVSWNVLEVLEKSTARLGPRWHFVKDFERWSIGRTSGADRMARLGKTRVEPHPGRATPGETIQAGTATPGTRVEPHPSRRVEPHPHQRQKDILSKTEEKRAAAPLTLSGDPDPKPKRSAKKPPPEQLEPEQRSRLEAWCRAKHPGLVAKLDQLIEACLRYSRREGQTKWRADYYAACQDWIDKERKPNPAARGSPNRGRAAVGAHDEWSYAMEES